MNRAITCTALGDQTPIVVMIDDISRYTAIDRADFFKQSGRPLPNEVEPTAIYLRSAEKRVLAVSEKMSDITDMIDRKNREWAEIIAQEILKAKEA